MGGGESIAAKSSIGGRGRTGHDAAVRHRVLTAIDLFAGAGGFSLGLRRAGFDVVLANEYSVDAEWTYRHNILGDTPEGVFPERPDDPSTRARKAYRAEVRQQMLKDREALPQNFERHMRGGDVREMLPDPWLRTWLKRHPAGVDLLVAGPPCQGFSCAGRAGPDDERNLLVHEAIRVIGVVQPRIAILENVPGMLERHADLIREIGLRLSRRSKNRPGYYVYAELVHGEPLGVPQTRRRLLLVAVRRDLVHPSACERLPRLLFPVACPHSRPTDGRLLGAAVPAGSSLAAKEILGDLAGTPAALRDRKEMDPAVPSKRDAWPERIPPRSAVSAVALPRRRDHGLGRRGYIGRVLQPRGVFASPRRGSETPASSHGCNELARCTKASV